MTSHISINADHATSSIFLRFGPSGISSLSSPTSCIAPLQSRQRRSCVRSELGFLSLTTTRSSDVGEASTVQDEAAVKDSSNSSSNGNRCKGCGNIETEKGCNGEGRIQGGIGSLPGFGWWPIKAYRPCPSFLQAGGRYQRSGQSLDEIAFGRKDATNDDLDVLERLEKN